MSRRTDKTTSYPCGEAGCRETGYFAYSNRESAMRLERMNGGGKWRCVRHTKSGEVLTLENRTREITLTLGPSGTAPGLYWHRSDGEGLVSGFTHGPGWKAFAEDFPAGTRIVVRVECVLP